MTINISTSSSSKLVARRETLLSVLVFFELQRVQAVTAYSYFPISESSPSLCGGLAAIENVLPGVQRKIVHDR